MRSRPHRGRLTAVATLLGSDAAAPPARGAPPPRRRPPGAAGARPVGRPGRRRGAPSPSAARTSRRWTLGVLRPLTPKAPGTHLLDVFARWEAGEDRFVRRDVHRLEVWAADAQSAAAWPSKVRRCPATSPPGASARSPAPRAKGAERDRFAPDADHRRRAPGDGRLDAGSGPATRSCWLRSPPPGPRRSTAPWRPPTRPGRPGRRWRRPSRAGRWPLRRLIDAEQETLAPAGASRGGALAEAAAEVAQAAEVVHHFAAEAEQVWASQVPGATLASGNWIRPAPVGVVAAIVPGTSPSRWWSGSSPRPWPAARWSSSPPRKAPLAAWSLCDLAEAGDRPAAGPGHLPDRRRAAAGRGARHPPRVAKVAFTGSRRVAELIAAWAAPRLQDALAQARRPRPAGGAARRRPRRRRRGGRLPGLRQRRPGLLRGQPGAGAPGLAGDLLERMRARIAAVELGLMATERGLARHRMLLEDARAAGARVGGREELGGGGWRRRS